MIGERLDQYLFTHGYTESREKAKALIMAGVVYIDDVKADKAGVSVPEGALVEVRGSGLAYVSRGGLKLAKAIDSFAIDLKDRICMDVGASTGGFTDCMLQSGAQKVYAVDVGYGQLAWKLRCDERVVNLERTNIRHLETALVKEPIAFFSVDVSFISLKHIFPVMKELVAQEGYGVCLVKPQFEAGKEKVGKKGVVREAQTHRQVIAAASEYARQNQFLSLAIDYSPIKGPQGNVEFLLHVQKSAAPAVLSEKVIAEVVENAHRQL